MLDVALTTYGPRVHPPDPMAKGTKKTAPTPTGLAPANINGGPGVIAPWPFIDRYPTTLGSNISVAYISSVIRLCMSGYRQQYVDLLDEMLVTEPHGYAVLQHRFNTTAGGRLEVTPPALPKRGTKAHPEAKKAQEIADDIAWQLDQIPERQKAFNRLLWGLYYGVSAAENIYDITRDGWSVVGLNYINSRRISYPDQTSWRPRIWDQGTVSSVGGGPSHPTTDLFGARVDDFPGKFILFEASIRGDYPTREGLGLQLVYWFGLKGIAVRGAGEYVERFGKPWALGTFSTTEPSLPGRAATAEDIAAGNAALQALGIGALSGALLPDSIKIQLMGPGVNSGSTGMTHEKLIALADAQIAEVVLTNSGITAPGPNGSRSSLEVMKEGTRETFRYDARCLADALKRDLVRPLVGLRHPGYEHLCPEVTIHVDEQPSPTEIMEVLSKAVAHGIPADADKAAQRLGIAVVPAEKGESARRMYLIKPTEPYDLPIVSVPPSEGQAPKAAPGDEDEGKEDDAGEEEPLPAKNSQKTKTKPKAAPPRRSGSAKPPSKGPAK